MPDKSTVLENENEERESAESTPELAELIEADLLVEDVSIDGMCGVY